MKKPAICLLTAIILIFTLIPIETVQAIPYDVEGYELWEEDHLVDDDVIIGDGDHLEIRNATITISCTERPMIEVQSGGRLTINSATLKGDGTAGCWQGILINSGDNLSSITDSFIFDAGYDANFDGYDGIGTAISIVSSGPTITGNEIANLRSTDAEPGRVSARGEGAAGIFIEGTDEDHVPTIRGNYIHHVFGATGFSGADGDLENGRGDGGQSGGIASGIIVHASDQILIENNVIEELHGGACGDGGDGLDGADGAMGRAR